MKFFPKTALGGGSNNTSDGTASVVCGGFTNFTSGDYSTVVGGRNSNITHDNCLSFGVSATANSTNTSAVRQAVINLQTTSYTPPATTGSFCVNGIITGSNSTDNIIITPPFTAAVVGSPVISSITISGSSANVGISIVPIGTGALMADVPDDGTSGGTARGDNAVDLQTVRSLATQVASGGASVIAGGFANTSSGTNSTVGGGFGNTSSGNGSTISGGVGNTASVTTSTVSGGTNNTASGTSPTVSGGEDNTASGDYSTICGGIDNTTSGDYSIIAGGINNNITHDNCFVYGSSTTLATTTDTSAVYQAIFNLQNATYMPPATANTFFINGDFLTTGTSNLSGLTMNGNLDMGGNDITNGGDISGTITTVSQPNITSVGNLTGLTMAGDINLGNNDITSVDAITAATVTTPLTYVQAATNGTATSHTGNYYSVGWNTATFQPTTSVFTAANFTNLNRVIAVPVNGIYSINCWFNSGAATNDNYLIMNGPLGSNDLNIGAANNASVRLLSLYSGIQGNMNWTGYMTTTDTVYYGVFAPAGAPTISTSRTGISISLLANKA